jgi:Bifunctional DNA primase/polymerase, N-terminal
MTAEERLRNILQSAQLGPLAPFFGLVNGGCECGKPKTNKHKPGKHPRSGGWQKNHSTTDEETITGWFAQFPNANFAVISGVESVVLDLDIRPGKNGVKELEALEAGAGQPLPPTITVISGSGTGAKHLYFRVPPDVAHLQKPRGTKGIDFQRTDQAVIVPGSLHESGQFYKFAPGLSPSEIELAELPDWLVELMRKPTGAIPRTAGLTDNIEELFDELLKMGPPAGALAPGRKRPDEIVRRKMVKVPKRKYPLDRSHSDSHWAWTLARNCCHHWDQYLRLWRESEIRKLPGTKCGRASYEGPLLVKAFTDQKQQWKSKRKLRPIEQSANPTIVKRFRKQAATQREVPRSPITTAVLHLHTERPELDDTGIARVLNGAGTLTKVVTRNNVKRIRHCYPHLW